MSEGHYTENDVLITSQEVLARIWPTGNVDSEVAVIRGIVGLFQKGVFSAKEAIDKIIGVENSRGGDNH